MTEAWRNLTADEVRLVGALLQAAPVELAYHRDSLQLVRVYPMDDGGMGSLRFQQRVPDRTFSREVAQLTFQDSDDVVVVASLSVNASGELNELDMFKGDFSPLLRIADKFAPLPPEWFTNSRAAEGA